MSMPQLTTASGGALAVVLGLVGVASTVFWMVVAWRAMRAHEDIADVLRGRARE